MSELGKQGSRKTGDQGIRGAGNQGADALPEGWVWTSIGQAYEVILGQSPPSSTYNTEGIGLPFYQGKAEFGDIYPTPVKWCSEPKKVAQAGDVLISVRAPVGPTNLCREQSCIGRGLSAIRAQSGSPNLYIYYFLRYIEQDWENKATGSTFSAITGSVLRQQDVPFAPFPEQHRIVEVIETQFTRLDAAVAGLKRAQANLKRYRASVLQAACEGRLVPTEAELARQEGRDYEPANQLLERILVERRAKWEDEHWEYEIERAKKKAAQAERKAVGLPYYIRDLEPEHWQHRIAEESAPYLPKSDKWKERYVEPEPPDMEGLSELPGGWVWASVDQLAWNIQYGHTESAKENPIGPKFLRITDIQDDRVNWDTVPYCNCSDVEYSRYHLEPNDLVFARTGATTGKSYLISDNHDAVFASYLIRLQFSKYLNPKYIAWFFQSPIYWPQIMTVKKGSAQPGVNATILATLHVPLPPFAEQIRIVAEVERRLSVVDALEQSVAANLIRAERMRQSILKKAFEGRLVEQNPDDEPASVLLERIKAEN